MDSQAFIPVKSDIVFRLFYADERNEEFLISLLKSMLRLPDDDYNDIEIADPHLLRDFPADKLAIIDVKLYTKNRKVIHIEIQLKVPSETELKKRIILYESKLITEQIGKGDDYETIQKVVSIIITDEPLLINNQRYHHRFTFFDPDADVEFSDIIEIHTLELRKLPDGTDGTELYDWARFIASESDEEMDRIAERNPEVKKAVARYRELTADERTRDMYERREKARRDAAMHQRWAVKQSMLDVARNALKMNMSIEDIISLTGLAREDVEGLSKPDQVV